MESQHSNRRPFRLPQSQQSGMGFPIEERVKERPHTLMRLFPFRLLRPRHQLLNNALRIIGALRRTIERFERCRGIRRLQRCRYNSLQHNKDLCELSIQDKQHETCVPCIF